MNLKNRSNGTFKEGFMLSEAIVSVALIGLVLSTILLQEQMLMRNVLRFSNKMERAVVIDNAFALLLPFFNVAIYERDKRIAEALNLVKKEKESIDLKYQIKKIKSDSVLKNKVDLNFLTIQALSSVQSIKEESESTVLIYNPTESKEKEHE